MLGQVLQHLALARLAARGSTRSEKTLWMAMATIASSNNRRYCRRVVNRLVQRMYSSGMYSSGRNSKMATRLSPPFNLPQHDAEEDARGERHDRDEEPPTVEPPRRVGEPLQDPRHGGHRGEQLQRIEDDRVVRGT